VPARTSRKSYTEPELYEYAIATLSRRMRTVAELKRLIRKRCQEPAMIEAIVARLKAQKYLNDSTYAAAYSTSRRDNERFGRRRVITDLKSKGVHGDVIAKAVEDAYFGVNEEELAKAFLRRKGLKKPANNKEAARIFRAMMRGGFSTGVSIRVLKNWKVDDEFLTALEDESLPD
jgi:regulatory protein